MNYLIYIFIYILIYLSIYFLKFSIIWEKDKKRVTEQNEIVKKKYSSKENIYRNAKFQGYYIFFQMIYIF